MVFSNFQQSSYLGPTKCRFDMQGLPWTGNWWPVGILVLTISMGVRLYFTMHFICIFLVIYDDVFVAVVACAFCLINCFSLGMPINHLFICLFSEKKKGPFRSLPIFIWILLFGFAFVIVLSMFFIHFFLTLW